MKNMVLILALVFSTSAFCTSAAKAESDTYAQTTASALNVRDNPYGKTVIQQLPRGSVVAILQLDGLWANILYLEDNDPDAPKKGWVSAMYLRILYSKDVSDYKDTTTAGS